MMNLREKIALITGGSRGIGRAIAIRLAEQGADIIVNYFRHKRDAGDTAAAVEKFGRKCLIVKANVADIALFLCSDLSAMIQGQVITVDGGYAIRG
jgi:enoyl-[acyl-carrier protein] reductase III